MVDAEQNDMTYNIIDLLPFRAPFHVIRYWLNRTNYQYNISRSRSTRGNQPLSPYGSAFHQQHNQGKCVPEFQVNWFLALRCSATLSFCRSCSCQTLLLLGLGLRAVAFAEAEQLRSYKFTQKLLGTPSYSTQPYEISHFHTCANLPTPPTSTDLVTYRCAYRASW